MTDLQQAESSFDEAEREEREGDIAALAERNFEAEFNYERARICRLQGTKILNCVIRRQQKKKKTG